MAQPNQPKHPISGDDVMLVRVQTKPKQTGGGYSTQEQDELLNTPVSMPEEASDNA